VGEGSPGSREAEGEGGEGFYIAGSGRRPDLLAIPGLQRHLERIAIPAAVVG